MKWSHLYEYYDGWSPSTLAKRLSSLEEYGTPDELIEVAESACDEKAASNLIRKAVEAGVSFTPDEILELDGVIDSETLSFITIAALKEDFNTLLAALKTAGLMEADAQQTEEPEPSGEGS